MERVPDRVAAEWVVSRLDWKYALHLPLDYAGFHFTDLLAFRKRLLEHQQERVLFDSFLGRLRSLGLIKSGGKMRTDSTHVLGLLEKLGRMELVTESVRLAVEAIAKAAPHWTETHLPAAFLETYPRRQSEYGLSNAQVQAKLMQAGQDGFWLLNLIDQAGTAALRNLPEVAVLRQVLTQQFPHGPNASPPAQRPAGKQVIESPHERKHGMARNGRRNGAVIRLRSRRPVTISCPTCLWIWNRVVRQTMIVSHCQVSNSAWWSEPCNPQSSMSTRATSAPNGFTPVQQQASP